MRKPGDVVTGGACPYVIEEQVGRGGFGVTYRARAGDTVVALKELRIDELREWKEHELFEREAAALRKLAHPRIPGYVDSFELEQPAPSLVLVHDWIEGTSLASYVQARGSLDSARGLKLFEELLTIVGHLHAQNPPMIHRDIKPQNIIIDKDGAPYLIDFGAVQSRIRNPHSIASTAIGTLGYAPIEQFVGESCPPTDLYALAMTVLFALTGHEPGRLSVDARTGRVDVRRELPYAPASLCRTLCACLEPGVARRPISAAAAAGMLRKPVGVPFKAAVLACASAVAASTVISLHMFRGDEEPPSMVAAHLQHTPAPMPGDSSPRAWFARVRGQCNPVEVELAVKRDPPEQSTEGVAYHAACIALAGKLDKVRHLLNGLPGDQRGQAIYVVFEIIHPIADMGDDESAGPVMRLVLEYWPENYMALYHAGMSEYITHEPDKAREHLRKFLTLYTAPDGWTQSAKRVLAELDSTAPIGAGDCDRPLLVDPEGKKVWRKGCR